MSTAAILSEIDSAIGRRNPILLQHLRAGAALPTIRKKLAKVPGSLEPLLDLYSWHNGTEPQYSWDGQSHLRSFAEMSLVPCEMFFLPDLELMACHFGSFREIAKHHKKVAEAVNRYFPILWDGSTSWLTVDLTVGCGGSIVYLDFENDEPCQQAYSTFAAFLCDLLRANELDETLSFFR